MLPTGEYGYQSGTRPVLGVILLACIAMVAAAPVAHAYDITSYGVDIHYTYGDWTTSTRPSVDIYAQTDNSNYGITSYTFEGGATNTLSWESNFRLNNITPDNAVSTGGVNYRIGVTYTANHKYDFNDLVTKYRSRNFRYDGVAPSVTMTINSGATYTNSRSVTLNCTASDGQSGLKSAPARYYETAWSGYESYTTAKAWTLTSGDGTKRVYYRAYDNVDRYSQVSDTIILDTVQPSGSISVNSGATYTTSQSVTLNLSASDATSGMKQYITREEGQDWDNPWIARTSNGSWTKAYTLTSGDGTKTVRVRLQDQAGNNKDYLDDITLDTRAPSGGFTINGGATYTSSTSVTLDLSAATDATSGLSQVRISNDGSTWTTKTYATSTTWTIPSGNGTKTVYVRWRDQAGNTSGNRTQTITLDTTAPSGTVVINSGSLGTNDPDVTLTLSASDAESGVSQMRISNNGVNWSTYTYATSRAWNLETGAGGTAGDGTKTIYVQFKNGAGTWSSPSSTDNIYLERTTGGGITINGGATFTDSANVTLSLSGGTEGVGYKMRLSNNGSNWTSQLDYAASYAWDVSNATYGGTSADGSKKVFFQLIDLGGVAQPLETDTIVLDTTAPSGSIVIENDAAAVNTLSVTLTPAASDSGSGVSRMRFSNDGANWSGSATAPLGEPYATGAYPWTLASGADGTRTVYAQYGDELGNWSAAVISDDIDYDTTSPSLSLSAPSDTVAKSGDEVTFTVTYTNYESTDTISLSDADIQLSTTGDADAATMIVSDLTDSTRQVALSGLSGDGTIAIRILAGTSEDQAGNTAPATSFSTAFTVDNTAPTLAVSAPSATVAGAADSITYDITYSGADTIRADEETGGVYDLVTVGGVTGDVSGELTDVTVVGNVATVTLGNFTGNGNLYINVLAGSGEDAAGNTTAPATSDEFRVDTTPPTVSIGAPSASFAKNGDDVTFEVTLTDADVINITDDATPGDGAYDFLQVNTDGTAAADITNVSLAGNVATVTVSHLTGDGDASLTVLAGAAEDTVGNENAETGPSDSFSVDNTAPAIEISAPDPTLTAYGPAIYTVTYTGASTITLDQDSEPDGVPDLVSLTTESGDATGEFSVLVASTSETRQIQVYNTTGTGDLSVSIAAGSASDEAGNLAGAATVSGVPAKYLSVSAAEPTVSISAPSPTLTKEGPVTFTVVYSNMTHDSVDLDETDITLNTTGTATATTINVDGTGDYLRTVTLEDLSGDGTIGISIPSGTATRFTDSQPASGATSLVSVEVDNTPPALAISAPSIAKTNTGPVNFTLTFTGASAVDVQAEDIEVSGVGADTVTADIAVVNGTSMHPTVVLSNLAGDGSVAITVGSGVAVDLVGNTSVEASSAETVTVDNTPPEISIGTPTPLITNTGVAPNYNTVDFEVTYTGADSVSLSPSHVTLLTTGDATATVTVIGTGDTTRIVRLFDFKQTNGTIGIAIASGTAVDDVGNQATTADSGTNIVTIDNIKPVITRLGSSPVEVEWTLDYVDDGATASDNLDGDLTGSIVTNLSADPAYPDTLTPATYTVTYDVVDTAGNHADTVTRTIVIYRDPQRKRMLTTLGGRFFRPDIEVILNPGIIFSPISLEVILDRYPPFILPDNLEMIYATCYSVDPGDTNGIGLGTVTIWYQDEDDDGYLDGTWVEEENIRIIHDNGFSGELEIPEAYTVDTQDNSVTINVRAWGNFALAAIFPDGPPEGDDPTPETPSGSGLSVSGLWTYLGAITALLAAGFMALRRRRQA